MSEKKIVWWKTIFANYNPLDDKIEYCNKGSLQYLHEERHKQQFTHKKLKLIYKESGDL